MTIDEIAKLAGVSKTTVSRVLNNKPDVSKETLNRVNAVIRDTGYTPNAFAKAINDKRSNTIGLVIPYAASYIFSSQYFSELLRGISTLVDERSYCLMLCYPSNGNCIDFFKQGRVDGFVVITPGLKQVGIIDELLAAKAPFILTSELPQYAGRATWVDVDEYTGAHQAVEHLVSLGHTQIAYIGEADCFCSHRREEAYRNCLLENDIPCHEEYICLSNDDLMESGYTLTNKLMELPNPPTAIFCSADMVAIGANRALNALGIRIPQDVSLVGFDDVFMSQYLTPPLTTVHQSAYDRGYVVAKNLIDFLHDNIPMKNQMLDLYLQIRDSSVAPSGKLCKQFQ